MENNRIKQSKGEVVFKFVNTILMLVFTFICLYPILYVLFASLSSSGLIMAHRGLLFKPLGFTIQSYIKVMQYPMILKGYANTLVIVGVGVTVNMLMTITAAFFLSRKNVKWQAPIMFMIVFTMFFSGGLIPFYLTIKGLGLENTYWSLILPTAVNTFNLIIMRTGFATIPDSIEESAKIDGANAFTILWRICLPLVKPMLAVILLYYAVERWNAWFYASILINDRTKFPLQLILREILISNDTSVMTTMVSAGDAESVAATIKYAVIIVATLPILCLYPFLQKYFTKGVLIGSVKG